MPPTAWTEAELPGTRQCITLRWTQHHDLDSLKAISKLSHEMTRSLTCSVSSVYIAC